MLPQDQELCTPLFNWCISTTVTRAMWNSSRTSAVLKGTGGGVAELLQGCFCSLGGPFHVSSDVNPLPPFREWGQSLIQCLCLLSLWDWLLSTAPNCPSKPAYMLTEAKFAVTSSWCFSLFSVWGASLPTVLLLVDRSQRRFFFFL